MRGQEMKVKLNKPARVNCLPGEVEVTEAEYERLQLLNLVDLPIEKETRETPEAKTQRTTRKK